MIRLNVMAPSTPYSGLAGTTLQAAIAAVPISTSTADSAGVGHRCRNHTNAITAQHANAAAKTYWAPGHCGATARIASMGARPRPNMTAAMIRVADACPSRAVSKEVRALYWPGRRAVEPTLIDHPLSVAPGVEPSEPLRPPPAHPDRKLRFR